MKKISGSFDVKISPLHKDESHPGVLLGRAGLDKTYHGNLAGKAKGEMLSARTETEGSASYVALECVDATLDGKKGGFALQHNAWMAAGAQMQTITVVPDSGTGELKGLKGSMKIRIEDGQHFYDFEYEIVPG